MSTDPFMQGLFPQLGLSPEKSNGKNNGCGFKLIPEPEIGEGYLWTYPVNRFFSVTCYHLKYYKDITFSYHHPAMLVVALSSPAIAKAVLNITTSHEEQLLGYYLPDGEYKYTFSAEQPINNTTINFTPEFYNSHLTELYGRDFSDLPHIVKHLNGTIDVPSITAILKSIEKHTPLTATSELFYEAKALELIAALIEWHIHDAPALYVNSISNADRETIQRLIYFLQQHYCESLDVCNLSKMCKMSKSKLSELFRSITGVTIIEFINSMRIDLAKELLANSSYQIGEISSIIGYAQQSSFTFLFKQRVHMSPRDYRKAHRYSKIEN